MKKRTLTIVLLIIGITMLCISLIATAVKATSTDIIGGADQPTFMFVFSHKANGLYLASALLGLIAIIAAIVTLAAKKKR